MKKEIWHEDQPVLKGDLDRAQESISEAISERLNDTLSSGIVRDSQLFAETIPFEITVNSIPFSVDVASGIAYDLVGERVSVSDTSEIYNAAAPTTTTDNGIGGTTLTPQSTGCLSIPLTAGLVNYVFISYLLKTDVSEFSLSESTNERLFTKGDDGYKIEVVTDVGPAVSLTPNTFQPNANAIYLGAVDLTETLDMASRAFLSLREGSLVATVPTPLTTLNALGEPYAAGQTVTFAEHIDAVGTGNVTPKNPHGLSINDLTGSLSGKTSEQHEKYFHESGISSGQLSTISALYGSVVDSAGSPFIGPTYARDNFLIKKLLTSGIQNFNGDGSTLTFTLTGGLTFIPGSVNLKVYVNGELQSTPSQYSEVGNNAVLFVTAPPAAQQVSLVIDGEVVQINGTTVSSAEISQDFVIYFVDASGNFLDNGVYTAYLDATAGALRLAHNTTPTNDSYRVYGITTGTFTNLTTTALTTVTSNPNNFLLWQLTWDSTGFGLGNDNFALVEDFRVFGTVGSQSLARDSATDTVGIDHNVSVAQDLAVGGNLTVAGDLSLAAGLYGDVLGNAFKANATSSVASVSTIDFDADVLSVQGVVLTGVSVTANIASSGANGLDTGVEASSTWYALSVLTNATGSLTASLLSTSLTPTLPAGYTKYRRVGWVRNNASSDFNFTLRDGDHVYYDDSSLHTYTTPSGTTSFATDVPSTSKRFTAAVFVQSGAAVNGALLAKPTGSTTPAYGIAGAGSGAGASQDYNVQEIRASSSQQVDLAASNLSTWSIDVLGYFDPI